MIWMKTQRQDSDASTTSPESPSGNAKMPDKRRGGPKSPGNHGSVPRRLQFREKRAFHDKLDAVGGSPLPPHTTPKHNLSTVDEGGACSSDAGSSLCHSPSHLLVGPGMAFSSTAIDENHACFFASDQQRLELHSILFKHLAVDVQPSDALVHAVSGWAKRHRMSGAGRSVGGSSASTSRPKQRGANAREEEAESSYDGDSCDGGSNRGGEKYIAPAETAFAPRRPFASLRNLDDEGSTSDLQRMLKQVGPEDDKEKL
jgi:hypothetical protein